MVQGHEEATPGERSARESARGRTVSRADAAHVPIHIKINGRERSCTVDPRTTLLDLLREEFGLFGTKKGCDQGQCGACTVHINGRQELACLTLAVASSGDAVTTIEGLAEGEQLHPVQQAFVDCDALQCGYCTPGQIMAAVAMIEEAKAGTPSHATPDVAAPPAWHELSDGELSERMSGNICRCGAYLNIRAAIRRVLNEQQGGRPQ